MTSGFILVFTLLTLSAIVIVVLDKFTLSKRRDITHQRRMMMGQAIDKPVSSPWYIRIAREYWLILAVIYLIRAFIIESFSIPSTSMMPTLKVGDQIIVTKYNYGIYDPIFRHQLMETGSPERGDMVVFRNPEHPDVDYIKRVIGLPGDTVIYTNKQLYIAQCSFGKCSNIETQLSRNDEYYTDEDGTTMNGYTMTLGRASFDIALSPEKQDKRDSYSFIIGEDEYMVLGDNRDNSYDSRMFGLIRHENLVGKAHGAWLSIN